MQNVSETLIGAFGSVWGTIQELHPEVPSVVFGLGSGVITRQRMAFGHFAPDSWEHQEAGALSELFIGGEGLARGAVPVLGTLLHEAGHGLAHVRGVKDTSRQGRYHNARFKAMGEELGLTLTHSSALGWSGTEVPEGTVTAYTAELLVLDAAIVMFRQRVEDQPSKPKSSNLLVAECQCPRKIRVARSTLHEAPITCGACECDFVADDDEDD